MKEKIITKILSKSDRYNFYKDNYYSLKDENKSLILRLKRHKEKITALRERIVVLKEKNANLKEKVISSRERIIKHKEKINYAQNVIKQLSKKLHFITFDDYLSFSYIFPIVKLPFSIEDKECFAFMDYLAENLVNLALNSDQPLISIIMPTYNRKDRVLLAINSVLNQTYSNFELIIIDDASSDGTVDILNSIDDDRVKIISHSENKGVSAARNSGLKVAKGEYIAYLDSDNDWNKDYLSAMLGAFIKLPDADALYSGQILYSEFDSEPFAIRFGAFNKSLLHNRNYIDLNCFCHKAEIYEKIGGFDENLPRFVDWDLILRISNNFKIYSVPVLLSNYYNHSDNLRISNLYENSDEKYDLRVSEIINNNVYKYPIQKTLKRKVSVIIANYESLNELKDCVDSIISFNHENIDIIIVDNNSGNDVVDYLKKLDENNQAKIVLNDVNHNFTYCINQGIELSDENSDLLLLNNDAILTDGAITNMQKFAYDNEDCGIVVPQEILYGNHPDLKKHMPYANKSFDCNITSSRLRHNIANIPVFHDDSCLELNFAKFFCLYIKRDIYNKTAGFDCELDEFESDRAFSNYVRHLLNKKIYQCPDSFVYHNKIGINEDDDSSKNVWNNGESDLGKKIWDVELTTDLE